MTTSPSTDPFRSAVTLARDRIWVQGTSLLRRRDRLWRPAPLHDLHARLLHAVSWADGDLAARWDSVLEAADEPLVRLAAEALALHLLIASDIRADTKRQHITGTLARLPAPPDLPRWLDEALEHGATPTGVAFKRMRLSQVSFLVRTVAAWHTRTATDRREALEDPWDFRGWLGTVPVDGAQAQREAVLHLVHPVTFEPITSRDAKARIVTALGAADEVGMDLDEALLTIRARLTPAHGEGFSFGASPIRERWLT